MSDHFTTLRSKWLISHSTKISTYFVSTAVASFIIVLQIFEEYGRENFHMLKVTYATIKSIAIETPIELNIK